MELSILWLQQRGGSHETTAVEGRLQVMIVLEGLKGRPVAELCTTHHMSQAQYY